MLGIEKWVLKGLNGFNHCTSKKMLSLCQVGEQTIVFLTLTCIVTCLLLTFFIVYLNNLMVLHFI